jgi:predicted nucleic acid-binding protein
VLLGYTKEWSEIDKAFALFEQVAQFDVTLVQPAHFVAEVMGVITRLESDYANDIFIAVSNTEMTISDHPETYQAVIRLSVELNHHLFDTLYHAAVLNMPDTVLITADETYYRKAKDYGQIKLYICAIKTIR